MAHPRGTRGMSGKFEDISSLSDQYCDRCRSFAKEDRRSKCISSSVSTIDDSIVRNHRRTIGFTRNMSEMTDGTRYYERQKSI